VRSLALVILLGAPPDPVSNAIAPSGLPDIPCPKPEISITLFVLEPLVPADSSAMEVEYTPNRYVWLANALWNGPRGHDAAQCVYEPHFTL
jgi:hypothetical protein